MSTRPSSVPLLALLAAVGMLPFLADPDRSTAARTYAYDTPVLKTSPWPAMRRDRRNTGSSPIRARLDRTAEPWRFRTGKGVFSTPVIDGHDTAYFGSADRYFYAVGRDGELRWKLKTGEIIDSAGTLGARDPQAGGPTLTFGSADEHIYRLRDPERRDLSRSRRIVWRFRTEKPPQGGQIVNWWEGNVVTGPGGTLYAGNTGGGMYAISPRGEELWNHPTGNSVWSAAAIDDAGRIFFGSVDAFLYGIDSAGGSLWSRLTVGFNASSAAIGSDGTVYIGSFDHSLYALDPATGNVRWRFETGDHIYPSAALEENGAGETVAVYTASADGSIYKLDTDGNLIWRYDTGDPIRSSPALGRAPKGESGRILYVGSSDGSLYAIDTADGTRRWSYDTTPRGPVLHDRNDLNSSPALGKRGIWIGGESGYLYHVPYDYCLGPGRRDDRCDVDPGEQFGDDLTRTMPVTAGGTTEPGGYSRRLPTATTITGRLVVRRAGETRDVHMLPAPDARSLVADVHPDFPFDAQLSADGRDLHVVPRGFLRADTRYRVDLAGDYAGDGSGSFSDRIEFRTRRRRAARLPLEVARDRVGAFNLRRLSLPLPSLLPSVNQIGFDSYDWIAGTLDRTREGDGGRGRLLLWVIGSRERNGERVADPKSEFAFPLTGRYAGDSVILDQRSFSLLFTFGRVPLDRLGFRGSFDPTLTMRPGAAVYGEVDCPSVPNLGALLLVAGLCNDQEKLIASGTYLTSGYRGPANRRPDGVALADITLTRPTATTDGSVAADLRLSKGADFGAGEHTAGILLLDAATGRPLPLDYDGLTKLRKSGGRITGADLRLPAGTALPDRITAYAIADVFPLGSRSLR
ncbi:MAG: PQQ-like beta-propeller repeat protein [Solirubrobacterales bacterium]|nr:PQQ-like beta-propeller repeat protein [Solirubrobacterales bacterium]